MELTSPVWATMLDKEKGRVESTTQQIHLKDDDPLIFLEVLRIVYQNHAHVEGRIPNQRFLFQLIVFCDKYDLGLFMRPFVVSWKRLDVQEYTPYLDAISGCSSYGHSVYITSFRNRSTLSCSRHITIYIDHKRQPPL